jgi:Flp pilus assembly protein TadG
MRTGKRQKGVAIVEFALAVPLMLIMSFITTEFGRAVYQYNTLAKSVRDAARYLSIQTPGTHQAEAANLIVYGNTAGTGRPLAVGLNTSHVAAPVWSTAGSTPTINTVTVGVTGYTFSPMVATAFGLPFATITFSDIRATMRSHL